MASSSVTARRYFAALGAHDLDAALQCWAPGATDRLVGVAELTAPDGVRRHYEALFDAFPDFGVEVLETTTQRERCVVHWRATGTFVGPGRVRGALPNGARLCVEGCDVLRVEQDLIVHGDVYVDSAEVSRQLGLLPAVGSAGESRLTRLANGRTRLRNLLHGAEPEAIAAGVWVLRGGLPRTTNVYLLEDDGGVTVFDAGVSDMRDAIAAAGVRLGGIRRVVLGHADCDQRGGAAGLDAPIHCHPLERSAAGSPSAFRDYWDLGKLSPAARFAHLRLLPRWDGGALAVVGTVEEGDQVAGFRVVHLPGHAPGLIGLFRESDRLALVSDCFYTIDVETGRRVQARVPHPAFNRDTGQARESIRKLASLEPSVVWSGHARPVAGDDVELQLQRAAAAPV